MSERSQFELDVSHARSCATNVQRCAADSGPGQVAVGNQYEYRIVDRWDALIDAHARLVLLRCRADPQRVVALESHYAHRSQTEFGTIGGCTHDTEGVASRLIAEALCLLWEAGALADDRARARLLAGLTYQVNRQLGADLDTPGLSGSPDELAAVLDRIDAGWLAFGDEHG